MRPFGVWWRHFDCFGATQFIRCAPVKLSVKSDYAARAVLGLARHFQSGESLKAEELADSFGIPANYLVQILIELKSQQIVRSVRGRSEERRVGKECRARWWP